MSWETVLLVVVSTETVIIGWFLRDTYSRVTKALKEHDRRLAWLDRSRERHRVKLVELCIATPRVTMFTDYNDD